MAEGSETKYKDFLAAQRSRLVARTDLQRFKTGVASDSFHSYDPREKVRFHRLAGAWCCSMGVVYTEPGCGRLTYGALKEGVLSLVWRPLLCVWARIRCRAEIHQSRAAVAFDASGVGYSSVSTLTFALYRETSENGRVSLTAREKLAAAPRQSAATFSTLGSSRPQPLARVAPSASAGLDGNDRPLGAFIARCVERCSSGVYSLTEHL